MMTEEAVWVSSSTVVTADSRSPGAEQLLVLAGTHRHPGQPALQGVGAFGGHEAGHGAAMLGDLDLLSVGDSIKQRKDLGLDLGSGHLNGHTVTY
jgi:hypothetical protein